MDGEGQDSNLELATPKAQKAISVPAGQSGQQTLSTACICFNDNSPPAGVLGLAFLTYTLRQLAGWPTDFTTARMIFPARTDQRRMTSA